MIESKIWIFIYMFSTTYCDVCHENCKQIRIQGFYSADCYDQNLREVPDCLSSSIEILDLSMNRIRKISESDLRRYSYIQILYLTDNVITNITEEALQDKSELHTLDLSYNVLYNIPRAVFHLSKLRKLSMSHVESPNMVEDIENAKPIESPLVYLDLSYNKLPRLPRLGIIPSLSGYNISGNNGIQVSATDFAGLCNLQLLINERTAPQFDDQCECWKTELWLKERNVTFSPFNCKPIECSKQTLAPEDLKIYNNCRKLHEEQMLKSFTSKLLTNIGIAGAVVILLLILTLVYIIRRKRQQKQPRNSKIIS